MRRTKRIGRITLLYLIAALLVPGCGAAERGSDGCKASIEWVDFLMLNDVMYHHNDEGNRETAESPRIGEKLGEVAYKINGHACLDYVPKNGDAAYLPVGTPIFEVQGYKPEFRVAAGNRIYQVWRNPRAATMKDLLDIEGKVTRVALESGYDGSPIGDFDAEAASEFVRALLPLPYVGRDAMNEQIMHEPGVFLRVHLSDGTSFRMVYYPKANAFSAGAFGTERLKELIMTQRQQIKAAAGM